MGSDLLPQVDQISQVILNIYADTAKRLHAYLSEGALHHLIRPVPHKQGLFLYLVLDKSKGNLAMARFKLMEIEKSITV